MGRSLYSSAKQDTPLIQQRVILLISTSSLILLHSFLLPRTCTGIQNRSVTNFVQTPRYPRSYYWFWEFSHNTLSSLRVIHSLGAPKAQLSTFFTWVCLLSISLVAAVDVGLVRQVEGLPDGQRYLLSLEWKIIMDKADFRILIWCFCLWGLDPDPVFFPGSGSGREKTRNWIHFFPTDWSRLRSISARIRTPGNKIGKVVKACGRLLLIKRARQIEFWP